MYRCPECGRRFDYPDYLEVCIEDYCGVGSLFRDRHYGTFAACPYCGEGLSIYDEVSDESEE